ncbi:MAG: hypothetical protein ACR2IJ_03555 [Fluviibacter sp.]
MSLVAHILLGKKTRLPQGTQRLHTTDPARKSMSGFNQAGCARNEATRLHNVERCLQALSADCLRGLDDIAEATLLSRSTVLKAMRELEYHGRIVRHKIKTAGNYKHLFGRVKA